MPVLEVDAEHGARQDVRDGAFHLDRSFFHLNLTFGELASESRPRCQFKCSSLVCGSRDLECVANVSAAKVAEVRFDAPEHDSMREGSGNRERRAVRGV